MTSGGGSPTAPEAGNTCEENCDDDSRLRKGRWHRSGGAGGGGGDSAGAALPADRPGVGRIAAGDEHRCAPGERVGGGVQPDWVLVGGGQRDGVLDPVRRERGGPEPGG